MKIAVFMGGEANMYGGMYTQEYFNNIWKESLLDKDCVDEVVVLSFADAKKLDEKLDGVEALIGAWITDDMICEEFLAKHPKLKYISTTSHGFGRIDKEACKRHGVTVTNTIYGDVTIAQYAFGLLLDICHNVSANDHHYRVEKWLPENKGKRILTVGGPQIELYGKTFGIIGLGNIGLWAARMAAGFGMKVKAFNRSRKEGEQYNFIEQVSLDELLSTSDVISIHCPLTDETRNLVDRAAFEKMKDGVILINTARGAIIDEDALYDALKSGKVYAAGLDVVAGEPLQAPCRLMECENTRITEHIAWLPVESRVRSIRLASENFLNWVDGHPTSVVS